MSEDQLMFNQQQQEKAQEPAKKAVEVLEAGINAVLLDLGVDLDKDIIQQQSELGIIIQENTDERTPHLNGFYIFQVRGDGPVPIAWVGSARMDSSGKCWIDIEWFDRNIREETGGIQVIK